MATTGLISPLMIRAHRYVSQISFDYTDIKSILKQTYIAAATEERSMCEFNKENENIILKQQNEALMAELEYYKSLIPEPQRSEASVEWLIEHPQFKK